MILTCQYSFASHQATCSLHFASSIWLRPNDNALPLGGWLVQRHKQRDSGFRRLASWSWVIDLVPTVCGAMPTYCPRENRVQLEPHTRLTRGKALPRNSRNRQAPASHWTSYRPFLTPWGVVWPGGFSNQSDSPFTHCQSC